MSNEKKLQEKYLEFQLLMQQSQQLEQAIQTINKQVEELNDLKQVIDDISKVKEGNELLIPLGAGIFLKGKLDNTEELLMNVGSKIVVKKKPKDALKIINEQIDEMSNIIEQTEQEHMKLMTEQQSLQMEVQKLIEQQS